MAKARYYCFTVNDEMEIESMMSGLDQDGPPDPIHYVCGQLEQGEHLHFQGYLELSKPTRIPALKKLFVYGAHYETRRGSREQARDYCMKEDTRVDGPWEWGEQKEVGQRSDLMQAITVAKEEGIPAVAEQFPSQYARYYRGIERIVNLQNQYVPKHQTLFLFTVHRIQVRQGSSTTMNRTDFKYLPIHFSGLMVINNTKPYLSTTLTADSVNVNLQPSSNLSTATYNKYPSKEDTFGSVQNGSTLQQTFIQVDGGTLKIGKYNGQHL